MRGFALALISIGLLSIGIGFAKDPPTFEQRVATLEKEVHGLKLGMKALRDQIKKLENK